MSAGKATLRELEEHYSVEDVYILNEVAAVEIYNAHLIDEARARQR